MGTLDNASRLGTNLTFRNWVMASMMYNARIVVLESVAVTNHTERLVMAKTILSSSSTYLERFVWVVCADPTVAVLGATPELVGEQNVIDKIAVAWTTVALL